MTWHWRKPACVCYNNAMKKSHIGSDFDDFLRQDGLLAECEAGALRRVVTWQITQEMKRRRISRTTLASRMKTSRTTLDRLFTEEETPVTLQLLERAALALGRKLKVELA
jgi:antitoxin HicB